MKDKIERERDFGKEWKEIIYELTKKNESCQKNERRYRSILGNLNT